jgi:branched-chain amino acid aminotransferase
LLEVLWSEKNGWSKPQIVPTHNFGLHPFNTTIHYAFEGFEGMKAYKDAQGKIRTFRPEMNAKRLVRTSEELCFPSFDPNEFVKCLDEYLKIEERWIPESPASLYLRPTIMSMTNKLGVHPPAETMLFVCAAPSGSYFKGGVKAIRLKVETQGVRAWPGGTGFVKAGANYAIGIRYVHDALAQGYDQVLWLNGGHVTEAGAMNFYMLWKNAQGVTEVVTPMLDGTILPGVTRDSVLQIVREEGKYPANERKIHVDEIVEAGRQGRVSNLFF